MNKEEITYKIPNNQIHISETKDENCLIWISPKALYMANTIDKLQHENKKYKEVIEKLETQQKEFIEWLEAMSIMYENEYKDIDAAENYNCVLKKYKEIIGDKENE